jgi:hypothetical protein
MALLAQLEVKGVPICLVLDVVELSKVSGQSRVECGDG